MKVLKKKIKARGEKGKVGEVSLIPESLDDLWHLKHVIEAGDLVYSLTHRRMEEATDKIRPDKTEKKTVRLGIRAESVEFHKSSRRLRIKGVIERGLDTELGSYHTFNIEPGMELSIVKTWKEHQLKRLREAEKAVASPDVIVVTIEEGEAVVGIVRQYGVDELFSIRYGSGKGMDTGKREGSKKDFFYALLNQLKNSFLSTDAEAVIIAGPGFVKNDFFSFLKEKDAKLAKITRMEQASSIGMSGFIEVLKRGAVERLKREERLTREVKLLDRLMEEISKEKDGKAVYGKEEVRNALRYGAIETLLVSDEKLMVSGIRERENEEERIEIESILKDAERAKGNVVVFSTEFEPGKRLNGLGGIAAILRFKVSAQNSAEQFSN
ncbi:MAG: mRNA surveillance protein pelota [Methanophagales archaeon]|nr:mRNA surveillance protein pelota [Methanophagales archaeon]MCW3141851.1 mRNA surveillance protein pelota [Methanophagales archaeon]